MDPRITNLETTTFFGRRQIAGIKETVAMFPKGGCSVSACLRTPERLEGFGILTQVTDGGRVKSMRGKLKKAGWDDGFLLKPVSSAVSLAENEEPEKIQMR